MADTISITDISKQLNAASRLVLTTDWFWVLAADGSSVRIPAEFVRAYLVENVKPTVGEDGTWYVDGKSTGVKASGNTPQLRGGLTGIDASYDNGQTWTQVVAYSDINVDVAALETAYKKVTDSEAARVEAESSRAKAESDRAKAESSRVAAEQTRTTAEEDRKTAESSRVTAETARASAESSRVAAESSRAAAENTRTENENARIDAEKKRASAETDRANAEKTRTGNESARVTAEQDRVNAEKERETAESARAENENARADAETERASAETQRTNAETQRESDFSSAKTACETATSNANTAADNANTATSKANTAADNANKVVYTMEKNMLANVSEVEKKANEAKDTIAGLVNGLSVTQTTGDSTTSVMSQKAVTDEIAKGEVSMTFNRYIGLSDVEKLFFDKYWSKDLQVHSSDAGMCCALLLRNCGYPLSWKCNNYGQWQYAILCNGVNEDGSIVDGKLCLDPLIDATGYKYILLTQYQGNRIVNVLPTYDDIENRPGTICFVEQKKGAEAVADEMRYASRLPGVIGEFEKGTSGIKIALEKDYVNLRDAMKASSNNYWNLSLIRHFPYISCKDMNNVVFAHWVNLIDVVWGDYKAVTSMFMKCMNLERVYGFEDSALTSIPKSMFLGCRKLKLRQLPAGVTSIGGSAFSGCTSLALTELPAGVTSIEDKAFSGCTSLALTELPAGVTSIKDDAFSGCTSLALTELPAGVTSIGRSAFSGCTSLALTELPAGVTSIKDDAFRNCTGLRNLTIPASVTTIGWLAFGGINDLSVTCLATTPPSIGTQTFNSVSSIKVPAASVDAYKEASGWNRFKDKITAIE